MISLKASRFKVEYDEKATNGYKVFTRRMGKYEDVTDSLTDDDKEELILDLIYAVTDLVKERGTRWITKRLRSWEILL